jgi:hypothetical protein
MKQIIRIIKSILSILLLLCLLKIPYGYYEFVRFISLIGFLYLSIDANKKGYENEMIIYGALALLFQPFFKIAFGREIWNIIDVIVSIGLILSIFKKNN